MRMGVVVVDQMLTALFLFSFGLYHMLLSTISFLKPPSPSLSYTPRPCYPLPIATHHHRLLRHLPLVVSLLFLLFAVVFVLLLPSSSSPSSFVSYQFLPPLLFLLALLAPSASAAFVFPNEMVFLGSSLSFCLLSAASSHLSAAYTPSDLQSKAASISSYIWAFSALSSLSLVAFSHAALLFLAELCLAASLALAGLWSFQSALLLYSDSFVPDGCHLLLDTAAPTTRCDLVESQLRADAIFDLAFSLHAALVAAIAVGVYAAVAKICGGGGVGSSNNSFSSSSLFKRHNAYEALPLSGLGDMENNNNITMMQQQMKPISTKASIAQE